MNDDIMIMMSCVQKKSASDVTTQNSALWDGWLDKYVKRLTADVVDVADVTSADSRRRNVMNAANPR